MLRSGPGLPLIVPVGPRAPAPSPDSIVPVLRVERPTLSGLLALAAPFFGRRTAFAAAGGANPCRVAFGRPERVDALAEHGQF